MFRDFLDYSNPADAVRDDNLAKLGDTLVNLIYSLARSMAKGEPDGAKAPNKVLSGSLVGSGLRHLASSRVDSHRLADIAEALVAYAWLQDEMEIEEAAEILADFLEDRSFEDRRDVFEGAEEGFKKLLIIISERVAIERS